MGQSGENAGWAARGWFDIVGVPLDDPEYAAILPAETGEHTCHDAGVILTFRTGLRSACPG